MSRGRKKKFMSFDEWVSSPISPEDCFGCYYNVPLRAHCNFPRACYYYERYCKSLMPKLND